MIRVGNDQYTEDELLYIIKEYEKVNGKYIHRNYAAQLPRETQEIIMQNLPNYRSIVKQPYENVNVYNDRYCSLPISKESLVRYIKSIKNYKIIYMMIIEQNIFTISIDNKQL